MPAIRVKTEKIEMRTPLNNDQASSTSSSSDRNSRHQGPQHAQSCNIQNRSNTSPYGTFRPSNYQQIPSIQPHPDVLAQFIGQASHEALLGTRNPVYLCALQEISEVRAVAATYQRQVINLYKELSDARNAYTQLIDQIKTPECERVSHSQRERIQEPSDPESGSTTATQIPESSSSISSLVSPASGQSMTTPEVGPAVVQPSYGPILRPAGLEVIAHTGPWIATPDTRPHDLPFEVFWNKTDWFGKGYGNGTFVTDRNGKHLKYLMKGIRKTARRIWTELERRPGGWAATTFNKNDSAFMSDYINTIEEIYPCLKLCGAHWKAKQIGISAYSHWYKNRNRYVGSNVVV